MPEYFKAMIAGLVFLIAAGPATAELFQYKDQNGITRLTDNIYSVPVAFRSQLEAFSEIEEIAEKMEIQPLEKKSSPPRTKEKTFIPKLDKTHNIDDEPEIVLPAGSQKIKAEVASKISPEKRKDLPDTPKAEHKASEAKKESPSTAETSILAKETDTIPDIRSTITKTDVPEERTSEQEVKPRGTGHNVSQSVIIDKGLRSPKPEIPAGAAENPPPLAISEPEIPARVTEESETVIQKAPDAERPEHAAAAPEKTAKTKPQKPSPSTPLDVKKAQGRSIKAEMQEKAQLTTKTDFHPPENRPKTIDKTVKSAEKKKIINAETARPDTVTPASPPAATTTAPKPDDVADKTATWQKKATIKAEIRETPAGIKMSGNRTTAEQSSPGDQQGTPVSVTAGLSSAPVVQQTAGRIDPESSVEKNEDMQLAYLQTTRKTLADKKEALNREYMELMEEKEKLEKSVDEDDEKSVREYNKNVKILNIKIKQYKNEKKALQAEIETYNSLIRQSSAN